MGYVQCVICRHCMQEVEPKRRRQHGAAHWLLLLVLIVFGAFFWPIWFFVWIPLAIPTRYHTCPACGLRLD